MDVNHYMKLWVRKSLSVFGKGLDQCLHLGFFCNILTVLDYLCGIISKARAHSLVLKELLELVKTPMYVIITGEFE